MNFAKLFQKSNSSIHQLQGNVLESTIEQIHGNKVIVDTGMRTPFVCFRNELSDPATSILRSQPAPIFSEELKLRSQFQVRQNVQRTQLGLQKETTALLRTNGSTEKGRLTGVALTSEWCASIRSEFLKKKTKVAFSSVSNSELMLRRPKWRTCIIGVEEKLSTYSGVFQTCIAPKSLDKICKRKFVWTELTKLWRSGSKNRIKGFILNSVNGGFAVAIAGYIAFMPKSLCINKKVFFGQWRQFAIIGMNPKIANIIVKEIRAYNDPRGPSGPKEHRFARIRATFGSTEFSPEYPN